MNNLSNDIKQSDRDYLVAICSRLTNTMVTASMYKNKQDNAVFPPDFLTKKAKQHFLKVIKKFHDYLSSFNETDLTPVFRQNLEQSLSFLRKHMEGNDQLVILNIYTFIVADFKWLIALDSN